MSLKLRLISIISFFILCLFIVCVWDVDNGDVTVTQNVKASPKLNHNVVNESVDRGIVTKGDPENYFQNELQKNININTDKTILNAFLILWMNQHPEVVMHYILTINDQKFQFIALTLAIKIWHDEKESALERWLLETEPNEILDDAMAAFCNTDGLDFAVSIHYAEKINNKTKQNNTIINQLKKWVNVDANTVISWVIKDSITYQHFGVSVFQEMINNDFDHALSLLSLLSNGDLATSQNIIDLFVTKAHQVINNETADIESISAAILLLPHSDFRDRVLLSLAPIILDQNDIYSSMSFLDELPAGNIQDSLQSQLISLLVKRDIVMALDYVALMNDDKNRQQILKTMTLQWAKNDLSAASEWLASSDIVLTDILLPLVQIAVNQKKTDIAIEWLNKTKSTLETAEFEFKIATLIYEKDPQSANEYLQETSQLSQENQTLLLQYIARNQK